MNTRRILASMFVGALSASCADAAMITIPNITVVANNDDSVGSGNPNTKWLGTGWTGLPNEAGWAGSGFDTSESGGTTEYLMSWSVSNLSDVDWGGYTFRLGLGDQATTWFEFSAPNDGLDFDAPLSSASPPPTASIPLQLVWEEDVLTWRGPILGNTTVNFTFSFDIADGLKGDEVWVYERPLPLPEPETYAMFLAGLGLVGFMASRRKAAA